MTGDWRDCALTPTAPIFTQNFIEPIGRQRYP
jgi:hypothetical protein